LRLTKQNEIIPPRQLHLTVATFASPPPPSPHRRRHHQSSPSPHTTAILLCHRVAASAFLTLLYVRIPDPSKFVAVLFVIVRCRAPSPSMVLMHSQFSPILPHLMSFVLWSKNIKRKHTYIKTSHDVNHSDESKNIFRGLLSHFFNVAQEFVSDIEEASIFHSSMDDSLIKLYDYRASKLQHSVPSRQSSNTSES
ncbi:hypothetical protein PIB30_084774, partial [Stylosanthes scabra]|nr:hypothetical protein [Stylosanthes scabra]